MDSIAETTEDYSIVYEDDTYQANFTEFSIEEKFTIATCDSYLESFYANQTGKPNLIARWHC